jgi:structural maintenance of chromosome 1
LSDAKIDKHEDARRKKNQEVVELFERKIPVIYDEPTNKHQKC